MKKSGKRIFIVDCSSGEWDSYHSWVDSLHETKKDAEARVKKIVADRDKFLNTPCPLKKDPRTMSHEESMIFWETTYSNLSEKEQKKYNDWDIKREDYEEWHMPKIYSLCIGEINKK